MVKHVILNPPSGAPGPGYEPWGSVKDFFHYRGHEVILSGPAETGKTLGALQKLNLLLHYHPGSQAVIVRKTRKSMTGSVLQTFEEKVIKDLLRQKVIKALGGSHVERYIYNNGSQILVGGMDNPDKVLSSERDYIYVNQAEELTIDDWEKLLTRCTGRAGYAPYPQLLADCNPQGPNHWLLTRSRAGPLKMFESRHEDNPTLFDPFSGEITEQGKRSLEILDSLTGVRYRRLRLGQWAAAEGAIYEGFDKAIHVIPSFEIPINWMRLRVIDFGYVNPFVCQWWAVDTDGRMYLYREIYMSGRIVSDHAKQIIDLSGDEIISDTICDHDAEDRATLEAAGIPTLPADKAVTPGIEAVQSRLRKQGDGKPRLYIFDDALVEVDPLLTERKKPYCTEQEFDGYVWKPTREGSPLKDEPQKLDDHGMDTMRYGVRYVDESFGFETISAKEAFAYQYRKIIPGM